MADVAVEDQDEIAQDFSCMRAHSQGTFSTGVDFGIDTTAPTIGLSRVPQKNDKNHVKYNVVRTLFLFLAARTRKNEKIHRLVLVPSRTAVKILLRHTSSTGKSNSTLWNHILKLQRQYRGP